MSAAEQPPRRLCLVGEGDFTLALSLATQLKHVAITATGFDQHADLIQKYRDAPATLRRLRNNGAVVQHGVDACALSGGPYDEVHFGHPHLGVENAAAHHRLLAHYFHSAKHVAPVVRVTLAGDQAERWRCDAAAARAGLSLKNVAPFHDDAFPGYTRRRSLSGGSFRARTAEASETRTYAAVGVEVAPVAWAALPRRSEQVYCPTCGKPCRDARGLAMHRRDATCAYAPPPRPPSPPPLPADDPAGCGICGASLPHPPLVPVAPAGLACAVCARTFKDDRALRQHAATCSRGQRRMKIHYVHGLEAGPKAFKARCLAEVGAVTAPAMATSLWNPFCANAFLGRFLSHFSWGAAARDVLDRCVVIQKDALSEPDVLVASSWGAAVALKLLVDRAWTGPTVLLCPGHRRLLSSQDADALVTAFRALPKKTLRRVVLVHGTADATVPIADSRELATDRARLVEVPGGSHGLGEAAADGLLSSVVLDALAKKYGAERVGEVFLLDS